MQMTEFAFAKLKMFCVRCIIKEKREDNVDPDVAAHYELPHLDLLCLQI